jgi:pyruvate/2-oxoglutarate/acetoin dehydrogenase E1 component
MKYFDELKRSMDWLATKPDTIFIGQAVQYAGTAMSNTLKSVDVSKLLEMPVAEDMQMGITNGLALNGYVPISIYPRWNFLVLSANQLINHLDKITMISDYTPKVIIRTGIGSQRPLHPQYQHIGDYTDALKLMVSNIEVIRVDEPDQIFESYKHAYNRTDGKSTLIIEWGDYYNEK